MTSARVKTRGWALIDCAAAVGAPLGTIGSFRGWLASVLEGGHHDLVVLLRAAAADAESSCIRWALESINRCESDTIHNAKE